MCLPCLTKVIKKIGRSLSIGLKNWIKTEKKLLERKNQVSIDVKPIGILYIPKRLVRIRVPIRALAVKSDQDLNLVTCFIK